MSALIHRWRALSAIQLALLLSLGAALTIATALVFEHAWGYRPCPLCLQERIPYYAAIPAGLLAGLLLRAGWSAIGRVVLVLAVVGLVWNAGLGVYHAGVEWKWWPGPAECGSTGGLSAQGNIVDLIEGERRIRCDEAAWRFLGLSFAGWSVVLSLGLAGVGVAAAMRRSRP